MPSFLKQYVGPTCLQNSSEFFRAALPNANDNLPTLRQAFFHAELSAGNARDVGDAFALAARSLGKAGVCTRQSWQTGRIFRFFRKNLMLTKYAYSCVFLFKNHVRNLEFLSRLWYGKGLAPSCRLLFEKTSAEDGEVKSRFLVCWGLSFFLELGVWSACFVRWFDYRLQFVIYIYRSIHK